MFWMKLELCVVLLNVYDPLSKPFRPDVFQNSNFLDLEKSDMGACTGYYKTSP